MYFTHAPYVLLVFVWVLRQEMGKRGFSPPSPPVTHLTNGRRGQKVRAAPIAQLSLRTQRERERKWKKGGKSPEGSGEWKVFGKQFPCVVAQQSKEYRRYSKEQEEEWSFPPPPPVFPSDFAKSRSPSLPLPLSFFLFSF